MRVVILFLLAFPALADSYQSASAYTHSYAQSSAQAGAAAGAISGGNTFQGGSTSYKEERQAPAAFAPAISPTAPCMGGTSAGGSGTGFGLSFGTSWTDDECNTRETARLMHAMGLRLDAVAVLCSSKYAQAAPSCAKFRPTECHADEVVAKRMGVEVCK